MPRSRSSRTAAADWSAIMVDTSLMCMDAWAVMGLRSMRMIGGGRGAEREAQRMIGEKLAAGFEYAAALSSGAIRTPEAAASAAVAIASRKVRANRRRLG